MIIPVLADFQEMVKKLAHETPEGPKVIVESFAPRNAMSMMILFWILGWGTVFSWTNPCMWHFFYSRVKN